MAAGNLLRSPYVTGIQQQPLSSGGEVVSVEVTVTVPAARTPNDVISLCKLPADHLPCDFIIASGDGDSGTSQTMSFGILNAAETAISTTTADGGAAWLASSTAAQTGVIARPTTPVYTTVENNPNSDRIFGVSFPVIGSATAFTLTAILFYRRSKYNA